MMMPRPKSVPRKSVTRTSGTRTSALQKLPLRKSAPRCRQFLCSLVVLGLTLGLASGPAGAKPAHRKKEKSVATKTTSSKVETRSTLTTIAPAISAPEAPAPVVAPTPAPTLLAANTAAPPSSSLKPVAETAPMANPVPPAPPSAPVTEAQTPTPPETPAPSPSPVPPGSVFYVEHLGAEAYPGDKRGLYGGSLWLEPSFHGLQWPYLPRSSLGFSGSAWVDTGYETITRGAKPLIYADTKEVVQQARAVLRATPTYSDGSFFVQGQVEVVGNGDQNHAQGDPGAGIVDIDDLWIRVGTWNKWDLKVGRYEAWEMYHTGMGLDINTIERRGATQNGFGGNFERPDYYGVTYLHDRPSLQDVGNVALHLYPSQFLRFELLSQVGADAVASNTGFNYLGGRPAAILDLGFIKIKVAGEYQKQTKSDSAITSEIDPNTGNSTQVKTDSKFSIVQKGVGGTLQFVFDPYLEFGVSAGIGWRNATSAGDTGTPDPIGTYRTSSIGAFANASGRIVSPHLQDLLIGLGANWTTRTDENKDMFNKIDYTANLQAFGAVQYLVAHQLFVKGVVAYARSDFDLSTLGGGAGNVWSNDMWSIRLRLMYLF